MRSRLVAPLAFIASVAVAMTDAQPIEKRGITCDNYTIINTRGTLEPQGPSIAFRTMNKYILATYPGGQEYDTVYPASINQKSQAGTDDIVNKVKELVDADPKHCIILQGYSQGAAATINAMPELPLPYKRQIRRTILFGNPLHGPKYSVNIDEKGGDSTFEAVGVSWKSDGPKIPVGWRQREKVIDVCKKGDGICDSKNGFGINIPHLSYALNKDAQALGQSFMESVFLE